MGHGLRQGTHTSATLPAPRSVVASPPMNGRDKGEIGHTQDRKERGWRFYAVSAAVVVAILFIFQNTDETNVKLLFADVTMPLFFALLLAVLLGFVIGWLAPKVRRGSREPS